MQLAGRDRNKRDPLLKIATGILTLEDVLREKQDLIKDEAIISMNDEGVPTVSGFRDGDYVELLQQQIEVLTNNREELQAIVDEAEAAFASFGLPSMGMESLDEKINEASDRAVSIARQINKLARKLLHDNPALTLPELFADIELQSLEGTRGVAITEGLAEAGRLIKLKDQLLPLCSDGGIIAEAVFHPQRAMVTDPARISELRSA